MASPIRPKDLDPGTPTSGADLIFDSGTQVLRASPLQLMDAARPLASQADAEAGADNAKVVSSLRVKQAIDAQVFDNLASAGAGNGASLVNTESGQSIQTLLKYARSSSGILSLGYDSVSDAPASVRIGGNIPGSGALVIGGAGKKDGGNGAYLSNDYHPQSTQLQNTMAYGPTELVIYGNSNNGIATGNGAGSLTIIQGSGLPTTAVGKSIYFAGAPYTVATVTGGGMTIGLSAGTPSGTHDYIYSWVTGSGTCSVVGTALTRTLGDPIVKYGVNFTFKLNGSTVTLNSASGGETGVLAVAPGNGTYTYTYELQVATNSGPLVTGLRLQKVSGSSEEGVGLFVGPAGYYLQSFGAGTGENYPLWVLSAGVEVLEAHATAGYLSAGGKAGAEAMRFVPVASAVNRIEARGNATGGNASLAARSDVDTNVSINLDAKGNGGLIVSNGSFGTTLMQVGGTGADYLTISAVSGGPTITAMGASANNDVLISAKGDARVLSLGTSSGNKPKIGTFSNYAHGNAEIGRVPFWGLNSSSTQTRFGSMVATVDTNTAASEASKLTFEYYLAGASAVQWTMRRGFFHRALTDPATAGWINAVGYQAGNISGVSGSFTTADAKTVTVTNGIITAIV